MVRPPVHPADRRYQHGHWAGKIRRGDAGTKRLQAQGTRQE